MRSKERIKSLGEVFTPQPLINEILDKLPKVIWFDSSNTWLDSIAGNGNFLIEIFNRLIIAGHTKDRILNNMLFGVDLMRDNCEEMIERLYGPGTVNIAPTPPNYMSFGLKYVFTHNDNYVTNIVCADGLKYDYSFGRTPATPFNTLFH